MGHQRMIINIFPLKYSNISLLSLSVLRNNNLDSMYGIYLQVQKTQSVSWVVHEIFQEKHETIQHFHRHRPKGCRLKLSLVFCLPLSKCKPKWQRITTRQNKKIQNNFETLVGGTVVSTVASQ